MYDNDIIIFSFLFIVIDLWWCIMIILICEFMCVDWKWWMFELNDLIKINMSLYVFELNEMRVVVVSVGNV